MGLGVRRAAALLSSSVVVLGMAVAASPAAHASTPTPADCTIFVVDGTAVGTAGDDVICGTEGDDIILGGGGNDTIFGFGGNDYIDGGVGADWIDGGYGADDIKLGAGDDYAMGGPGADRLWGGDGNDTMNGGSGDDALVGGSGSDTLNGGSGVDYCKKDGVDVLTSCYFDTSRPQVVSVALNRSYIDTSLAPKVVALRAHVKDSGTGVRYLDFEFARHLTNGQLGTSISFTAYTEGAEQYCVTGPHARTPTSPSDPTVCLVSGTPNDGVYEIRVLVPRWTATGTYILTSVGMRDAAGNYGSVDYGSLVDRHLAINFKQTGAGDSLSPLMRSIASLTKTIDTSQEAKVAAVRFRITDATSGTDFVSLGWARVVRDSSGSIIDYKFPQPETSFSYDDIPVCTTADLPTVDDVYAGLRACRESGGTRNDSYYRVFLPIPRWTGAGKYELVTVGTRDRARNTKWMQSGEIAARGLTNSFTQSGTGDETAPTASSAVVVTPTVDTGLADAQVTVRAHVKDAVSGTTYVAYLFLGPSGTSQSIEVYAADQDCAPDGSNAGACRISGTANDGVYEMTATLPAHSAAGTWKLVRVETTDHAGNDRMVVDSAVPALSFVNG